MTQKDIFDEARRLFSIANGDTVDTGLFKYEHLSSQEGWMSLAREFLCLKRDLSASEKLKNEYKSKLSMLRKANKVRRIKIVNREPRTWICSVCQQVNLLTDKKCNFCLND